jgi:hypothetical protein
MELTYIEAEFLRDLLSRQIKGLGIIVETNPNNTAEAISTVASFLGGIDIDDEKALEIFEQLRRNCMISQEIVTKIENHFSLG